MYGQGAFWYWRGDPSYGLGMNCDGLVGCRQALFRYGPVRRHKVLLRYREAKTAKIRGA